MRIQIMFVLAVLAVFLVACGKESMPYKSLADAKLSSPTGNVVGVQKELPKSQEVVEEKTPAPVEVSTNPSCKDSDYGKFASAAGKVKGVSTDGSNYELKDTCFGDLLYEYYCDGITPKFVQEKCSRGCKNGFCV